MSLDCIHATLSVAFCAVLAMVGDILFRGR
jgi:hypothetical protein